MKSGVASVRETDSMSKPKGILRSLLSVFTLGASEVPIAIAGAVPKKPGSSNLPPPPTTEELAAQAAEKARKASKKRTRTGATRSTSILASADANQPAVSRPSLLGG